MKPVIEKFSFELSLNEKQARWLRSQAAIDADTLETTANVFLRLAINQQIEQARRFPNGNLSK
jgi:hypothetical protein